MNEADRKVLREKIEYNLSQLEGDIDELKEMVKPIAPENAIGRISRMDAINNKSVNEAALRKAELRFHALSQALEDIDQPEFGTCVNCGENIPIGRLLLQPQSKSCVRCAH